MHRLCEACPIGKNILDVSSRGSKVKKLMQGPRTGIINCVLSDTSYEQEAEKKFNNTKGKTTSSKR